MNLVVDTHTHTYASGHAYSTLIENARSAKENGLAMFCTTDHAQSMPGAPHYWFFSNQRILPRFLDGVAIIRGIESNIMNRAGEIDVHPSVDQNLDWVIASFHEPVFQPADKAAHTEALINVIKGGRVDALGHLGNPNFDFDFDEVIACAAQHHVAIEINNSTLKGHSRVGSVDRCYEIAKVAKAHGAYVTTGSDAHFCQDIGQLQLASELLENVGIAAEKVITHSVEQFLAFLALRGRKAIAEYQTL
ncbi:phosphatase [Vibrio anguillarum]|uniref:Phosphatase n=1 Tax=Vibrio anguillarum TaxID=55601 RepID=A0A1Q1GHK9_VIBAN|nr:MULTISPECIES: phosphatase [Vibrio]OXX72401.1 phosphatase [Vibrio sp. V03_P4A6T147]AEH34679.1 DNA polymerase beta [Vibrio anguillarum 775]AGU59271.1 hydrolase [Vibrio anguillarum M3]AQM20951.1 phosphatase [Vibrio anguillarum]AQP37810.1 phosphatase [Vibrio anguillarum]